MTIVEREVVHLGQAEVLKCKNDLKENEVACGN